MKVLLSIIIIVACTNQSYGQRLFDKLKKNAEDKINKTANDMLNGKKKTTPVNESSIDTTINADGKEVATGKSKAKSEQTIIKETDFVQNNAFPKLNANDARLKIADNLLLDVNGKYPVGYSPKWRFISYKSPLDFDIENYVVKRSALGHDRRNVSIGSYNGKAVLKFGAFIGCDCLADIVIKDAQNVLTETPQTFKVTNFQKVVNERASGEKCIGADKLYSAGGWEGEITLSANNNGDIKMDLMIENYRVENRFQEAGVSYRYIAKNISMENEMTAEKANKIIADELAAKQRLKDYIAKTTRQADSVQKVIAKKYPQAQCRSCFYSSRGSYISSSTVDEYYVQSGNYAGSRTDYDVNTVTVIKNKCNYPITFIGIQQFYDEQNGYNLQEVTKTMEAGYSYSSNQGLMSSIFTSLIGGGSEFNFAVQDSYAVSYASVGSIQWLKVIKGK